MEICVATHFTRGDKSCHELVGSKVRKGEGGWEE